MLDDIPAVEEGRATGKESTGMVHSLQRRMAVVEKGTLFFDTEATPTPMKSIECPRDEEVLNSRGVQIPTTSGPHKEDPPAATQLLLEEQTETVVKSAFKPSTNMSCLALQDTTQ